MRKLIAILLTILTANICFGQNVDKKVIIQLYSKATESYFNKLALPEVKVDQPIPEFILVVDSAKFKVPINYKNFTLKIVKNEAEGIREIEKLHGKIGAAYTVSQKFSRDTLDVSINRYGVSVKKTLRIIQWHLITKHIFWTTDCGGTNGYIPTGRMVYNSASQSWLYSSGGEIFAGMKKRNPYL